MNANDNRRTAQLARIERNCTPYQYGVFCKALAAINTVFARERVTFAYFADDGNAEFFARVERAIIDGMANGPEPQEPTADNLNPVQGQPSEEYRPTYWWNND
jgi:hypothetical protein